MRYLPDSSITSSRARPRMSSLVCTPEGRQQRDRVAACRRLLSGRARINRKRGTRSKRRAHTRDVAVFLDISRSRGSWTVFGEATFLSEQRWLAYRFVGLRCAAPRPLVREFERNQRRRRGRLSALRTAGRGCDKSVDLDGWATNMSGIGSSQGGRPGDAGAGGAGDAMAGGGGGRARRAEQADEASERGRVRLKKKGSPVKESPRRSSKVDVV
jgi:hypothetical protein